MGITPQLNWECEKDSRFLVVLLPRNDNEFCLIATEGQNPHFSRKTRGEKWGTHCYLYSFTGGNFGDVTGVPATWGPFSG